MTTRENMLFAAVWTGILGYAAACVYALWLTGWLVPVIAGVVILAAVVAISEQHAEQQERNHDR